jgi:glycosyltransferase involved in cell wall biosynthesis
MKVALIAKLGHLDSGVGRYVDRLVPALQAAGVEVILVYPRVPLPSWLLNFFKKAFHWDLEAFFLTYPIWITYPPADLYHFTSQNLASLLIFHPPPGKVIVTVHDLIASLIQRDWEVFVYRNFFHKIFDYISSHALKKADRCITVSEFTSKTLVESLQVSIQKIHVIYEGI